MKRGLIKLLEAQGYSRLKRRVGISLIILILALIIFSGYYLFFYETACADSTNLCFVNAMDNCKRISWLREDAQAVWRYSIQGNAVGDACEVKVTLIEMREGTLDSEKLQGKQMTCVVQKGDTQFPEKDISRCSGLLKESLQDIIIQRMHNYLLKNVGEIKQEFGSL